MPVINVVDNPPPAPLTFPLENPLFQEPFNELIVDSFFDNEQFGIGCRFDRTLHTQLLQFLENNQEPDF